MDTFHTTDSQAADELLNDALTTRAAGPQNREADFRLRLDEYESATTSAGDELEAVLKYAVSDLLDAAVVIAGEVKRSVQGATNKLDQLERVQPRTDVCLKMFRQADRFINVGLRKEELRLKAQAVKELRRARVPRAMTDSQGRRIRGIPHQR